MEPADFGEAETDEPDEGWRRGSLAGSERSSVERVATPPGNGSPAHDHENGQARPVLRGELTVRTDGSVTLGEYDSVPVRTNGSDRVGNAGDERSAGLGASAPGRSVGVRTDREGEAR